MHVVRYINMPGTANQQVSLFISDMDSEPERRNKGAWFRPLDIVVGRLTWVEFLALRSTAVKAYERD